MVGLAELPPASVTAVECLRTANCKKKQRKGKLESTLVRGTPNNEAITVPIQECKAVSIPNIIGVPHYLWETHNENHKNLMNHNYPLFMMQLDACNFCNLLLGFLGVCFTGFWNAVRLSRCFASTDQKGYCVPVRVRNWTRTFSATQ